MTQQLCKQGIVKEIQENTIIITMEVNSACSACHAKGVCGSADTQEREIQVSPIPESFTFAPGQKVNVMMEPKLAPKALVIANVIPFLLMMLVLIILKSLTSFNDGIVGLSCLVILIPYYLSLYLLREKIAKTFAFTIHPVN